MKIKEVVVLLRQDENEGRLLADLIDMDTRTIRELADLLGVSETRLNKKRLLGTVKPLGKSLATKATMLFGLPQGTFKNAILPEDYQPVEPKGEVKKVTNEDLQIQIKDLERKVDYLITALDKK